MKDYDSAERWSRQGRALADETNIHVLDASGSGLAPRARGRRPPCPKAPVLWRSTVWHGLAPAILPHWIPRLCSLALQCNIEVSYVRALIRTLGWRPEDASAQCWPWPIRIYLFGRFELYVNDERVNCGARAPRKVLSLLKALTCVVRKMFATAGLLTHYGLRTKRMPQRRHSTSRCIGCESCLSKVMRLKSKTGRCSSTRRCVRWTRWRSRSVAQLSEPGIN